MEYLEVRTFICPNCEYETKMFIYSRRSDGLLLQCKVCEWFDYWMWDLNKTDIHGFDDQMFLPFDEEGLT